MSYLDNNAEPKSTDQIRRNVVKTALASAPVIATITSRPVQAVQGLSNMMSGNASDCRGDEFYGGMSPGFWKNPTGKTDPPYMDTALDAWSIAGYDYGTFTLGAKPNKWASYTGGRPFNTVFGGGDTRSLREVLNQDPGSDAFHLIAGLLNASYFQNKAGTGRSLYFLTVSQYWDLLNNPGKVPVSYTSLRHLIESNYHFKPNSDCGVVY